MSPQQDTNVKTSTTKTIFWASGAAAAIAALLAVTIVLPAEFGIDPLGTGRALGLSELADANGGPLESSDTQYRQHNIEFILEPFQSLEYKYHISQGDSMNFAWRASGELIYDMHAEPEDMVSEADVPSYDKGSATNSRGSYHAEFNGIHGWFWENRGLEDVILNINAAGFFTATTLFRDGGSYEQKISASFE